MKWLDFKITNRCNNRCVHCGYRNDPVGSPETLPIGTIQDTLDDAVACGFDHICFLGGEPTIRRDGASMFEPLKAAPDLSLLLITNGKTFAEPLFRAFFETAARRATACVSLDGLGHPSLKNIPPAVVLGTVGRLVALASEHSRPGHRCGVNVNTVISRQNMGSFVEFARHLRGMRVSNTHQLVFPPRVVPEAHRYNEFTTEELLRICEGLEELAMPGVPLPENARALIHFLHMLASGRYEIRRSCGAGRKSIVIHSDGSVYPCNVESWSTHGRRYGNVREERFGAIVARLDGFACPYASDDWFCWDSFWWENVLALEEARAQCTKAET